MDSSNNKEINLRKKIKVVFVLGGPGSGKGTQCEKIVREFGYTHLSAGELLRDEIKAGSENGTMIQNVMKEGKLVPSDVIVRLILKAMQETDNDKFLVDGFPRNEENITTFQNLTKIEPDFVLFLNCPEEEMIRRLLSRNQGREDDNIETIQKRFRVFQEATLPVVDYYASKGKLRRVDAGRSVEEVFESVKAIFSSTQEDLRPRGFCNCLSKFLEELVEMRLLKKKDEIFLIYGGTTA